MLLPPPIEMEPDVDHQALELVVQSSPPPRTFFGFLFGFVLLVDPVSVDQSRSVRTVSRGQKIAGIGESPFQGSLMINPPIDQKLCHLLRSQNLEVRRKVALPLQARSSSWNILSLAKELGVFRFKLNHFSLRLLEVLHWSTWLCVGWLLVRIDSSREDDCKRNKVAEKLHSNFFSLREKEAEGS